MTTPAKPPAPVIAQQQAALRDALGSLDADSLATAGIRVSGDAGVLARLAAVLDGGDPDFAIVTSE